MIIFGKPIHTRNIICYVFMLLGVGLIVFGFCEGSFAEIVKTSVLIVLSHDIKT